jgi:hypothetical protein
MLYLQSPLEVIFLKNNSVTLFFVYSVYFVVKKIPEYPKPGCSYALLGGLL